MTSYATPESLENAADTSFTLGYVDSALQAAIDTGTITGSALEDLESALDILAAHRAAAKRKPIAFVPPF